MTEAPDKIDAILDLMRENWPEASAAQAATVIAVHRLARLLQRAATEALAHLGLTPAEFELMSALRAHPAPHRLTPTDLYDAMLMSSGGLTKLLKGLEARGLVQRPASDGDRRSRPVQLSGEGREVVDRAMSVVQKAEAPMTEAMTAAWRGDRDLVSGLLALVSAAEAAERATRQ